MQRTKKQLDRRQRWMLAVASIVMLGVAAANIADGSPAYLSGIAAFFGVSGIVYTIWGKYIE